MRNRVNITLLIFSLALIACVGDKSAGLVSEGKGTITYQNDTLNLGRPITVWTYRPSQYSADSPVLFVIHGNSRTAENYREAWIEIAEEHRALLLVPHFTREDFPEDIHFNMGSMFKMDSLDKLLAPNPASEWSYSLIDPIFDFVVEKMKNKSRSYLIYGHSAGSQFLHRLLFFKPEAKVQKAICANAGWYTMPDFDQLFPYGLKETQCDTTALCKLFAKEVTVLLGDQDTDTGHSSLRRTPEAMQQGAHRFQRGHTFYEACRRMAQALNVQFAWDLRVVPGVAHSNAGMAPAAANALFNEIN